MTANPYAAPRSTVLDIADPLAAATAAERGTRLGASILDAVILLAMVYAPLILAAVVGAAADSLLGPDGVRAVMAAGGLGTLASVGVWGWLTIRYVKLNGQSIGKKLLGIKIVRSDGSPVSLGRVFWLRNVANWAISLVPLYGLVDLLFIFTESRQCLHDKLADTIVVKA